MSKIIEIFRENVSSCGPRGLEVGCGLGEIAGRIAHDVGFYVASDLAQYPRYCGSSALFVICDASHLAFRGSVFDWAIFSEVLEHLDKNMQEPALVELGRVIRPGGMLLLSTPNPRSLRAFFLGRPLMALCISKPGGQLVENWVSPRELDGLLHRAGFKIVDRCGTHYLITPVSLVPRLVRFQLMSLFDRFFSRRLRDMGWYQYRLALRYVQTASGTLPVAE